ncbi:hypothetical protein Ciccas_006169, partial [Cichlidogyrus casuarinus]
TLRLFGVPKEAQELDDWETMTNNVPPDSTRRKSYNSEDLELPPEPLPDPYRREAEKENLAQDNEGIPTSEDLSCYKRKLWESDEKLDSKLVLICLRVSFKCEEFNDQPDRADQTAIGRSSVQSNVGSAGGSSIDIDGATILARTNPTAVAQKRAEEKEKNNPFYRAIDLKKQIRSLEMWGELPPEAISQVDSKEEAEKVTYLDAYGIPYSPAPMLRDIHTLRASSAEETICANRNGSLSAYGTTSSLTRFGSMTR